MYLDPGLEIYNRKQIRCRALQRKQANLYIEERTRR